MKLACFEKVGLIAIALIASANTLPLSFVNSDNTFRNLNRDYRVVDGPKEFLVSLAPLRNLWGLQKSPFVVPEGSSDLDYMVYGKVYLMKSLKLGIADRSLFSTSAKQDVADSPADKDDKTVVLTRDSAVPSDKASLKDEENNKDEGIQFPYALKSNKRQYKFKFLNTQARPTPSIDALRLHNQHIDVRKIQERSAESETSEENVTQQPTLKKSSRNDPKSASEDESSNLDDEALELLAVYSPLYQPLSNNASENNTNGGGSINVDDRFLLQVPNKPQSAQCPEGQRRTHHGQCKPIVVHNHSPQDGIYRGRLTTPARRAVNRNPPTTSSSHLAAVIKTFVKLEKKLENELNDSERKLEEIIQGENSTTESTTTGESS